MEKRKFNSNSIAALKRTAANVYPLLKRRKSLVFKINEMEKEVETLDEAIGLFEAPIKEQFNEFESCDLVERAYGANGKARFVLKYPDTVLPPDDMVFESDGSGIKAVEEKPESNEINFTTE